MKIAVGGKGGSGKTTVAGTLARVLAERGLKVVAVDDDSNPNLALTVGLGIWAWRRHPRWPVAQAAMLYCIMCLFLGAFPLRLQGEALRVMGSNQVLVLLGLLIPPTVHATDH